ncbi:MAG: DegQ family serine endoprotease [Balneolales bacterium]|nr:DegQ family serine endoprotease [Balneolales bacterium]
MMTSQLPRFAAAFSFAFIILLVGYFSNNTSSLFTNSEPVYTAPEYATDQRRAEDRPIRSLRDLNEAFISLAESTSPTVVTITTERTVRRRAQMSPFDMFDDFFGRPRQQRPEQEFQQRGQGSGVIVSEDGIILTNHHVIANADTIMVRMVDNTLLGAEIIGSDPNTDIAVIRINGRNMPYLPLGDSDDLRVGELVLAIGSPLSENLAQTVTQGIVSAKGRSNFNLVDFEDFIQTDAAINPGNSGGPLINMDGELVGINTAIASRSGGFQGIGFAVPVNMAKSVMTSIIETGRVVRGYLGISGQELDESLARGFGLDRAGGAVLNAVEEGSPAAEAGLKVEDIILEYDGRRLTDWTQFRIYVASRAPGTVIRLLIFRDNEQKTINVTLGELPSDDITETEAENLFDRFGFSLDAFNNTYAERYNLRSGLEGVIVTSVNETSNAYRQGLREGDLVTAVNRRRVRNMQEFNTLAQGIQPGSTMLLQVVRRNQQFFVAIDI